MSAALARAALASIMLTLAAWLLFGVVAHEMLEVPAAGTPTAHVANHDEAH